MTAPAPDEDPAPPSVAALEGLDADEWAWLLRHARAALDALDVSQLTPADHRLRESPTSRLAGGRGRRQLTARLAAGGPLWKGVAHRLAVADPPRGIGALLAAGPAPAAPATHLDDDRLARLKDRARTLQDERDDARRRVGGEQARADVLAQELSDARDALAAARRQIGDLEDAVRAADDERARAVARERRRQTGELERLRTQLRELRRADQRRREEGRQRERAAQARRDDVRRQEPSEPPPRLRAGRPSVLPTWVRPGTREEADLLLHRGRLVIVDGYNVTRQHRSDLDLAEQRRWLVQAMATLAAGRGVRPLVVFDGQRAGSHRTPRARGVEVRFTSPGITADDEIVFAVAALDADEPVVVVTDDRDLHARVDGYGIDRLATSALLWLFS